MEEKRSSLQSQNNWRYNYNIMVYKLNSGMFILISFQQSAPEVSKDLYHTFLFIFSKFKIKLRLRI